MSPSVTTPVGKDKVNYPRRMRRGPQTNTENSGSAYPDAVAAASYPQSTNVINRFESDAESKSEGGGLPFPLFWV